MAGCKLTDQQPQGGEEGRAGPTPAAVCIWLVSMCCPMPSHLPLLLALQPMPLQHPFVGLVFMVGALVLETVLFIIRTTVPPKLHQAAAARATAARVARQQEALQREMAAAAAGGGGEEVAEAAAAGSGGDGGAAGAPKPAAEKKAD